MNSTVQALPRPAVHVKLWLKPWPWIWAAAMVAVLMLHLLRDVVPWAAVYPDNAVVPVTDWINVLMKWLKVNFTWLTRGITAALGVELDFALNLLAKNFKIGHGTDATILPRLSWVGVIIAAFLAGRAARDNRLGLVVGACFLYVALFGKWTSTMLTLGLIVIAVPVCIVAGLGVGLWAWRHPTVEKLFISPMLDLMQTIPTFAYLIPMLLLFGNSPVSAMLATAIFAMPLWCWPRCWVCRGCPPNYRISATWPAAHRVKNCGG